MEKSILMLLLLVLCLFLPIDAGSSGNWDRVASLEEMSAPDLTDFLSPIIQAAANAYRYPKLKPVPGWIPAPDIAPLAPPNGAHALVYLEEDEGSRSRSCSGAALILAFRGTDLTSQADLCADGVLFGDTLLDAKCDGFSNTTLDYYSQAVRYTAEVVQAYPRSKLLLTGHSLGAALAALVSAHFSTAGGEIYPVVSFSSPAMAKVLEARSLELAAARENRVYVFADEWDFILEPISRQVGVLCLYQSVKPQQCRNCHTVRADGCFGCFQRTHFMNHVMDLVQKSGKKPLCNESLIMEG